MNILEWAFYVFVAVLLCACGSAPVTPVAPDPVVVTKKTVDIDPSLLQDCPPLGVLDTRNYSKQQALNVINSLVGTYSTCWHNHHALSLTASKAFNLDTPASNSNPVPNSK